MAKPQAPVDTIEPSWLFANCEFRPQGGVAVHSVDSQLPTLGEIGASNHEESIVKAEENLLKKEHDHTLRDSMRDRAEQVNAEELKQTDAPSLSFHTLGAYTSKKLILIDENLRHSKVERDFIENEPTPQGSFLWYRWRLGTAFLKPQFQALVILMIFLNGIVLGLETDGVISHQGLKIFEIIFIVTFNFEIAIKLATFGPSLYLSDAYNIFDALIVLSADIVDIYILLLDPSSTAASIITTVQRFPVSISACPLFQITGRV